MPVRKCSPTQRARRVWTRPTALPRAWLTHQVRVAQSEDDAIRLTLDPAIDLRTTAVLDRHIQTESCAEPAGVAFTAIDEQHLRLDASPACAGVLVVSDNWYPGWQATLDGHPIDVLRADGAIRAVANSCRHPSSRDAVPPITACDGPRLFLLATLSVVLLAALWPGQSIHAATIRHTP